MNKLYNNKNLYDWIVWISIIAMMINVFFPFKGAFYMFALMIFAMARYGNLADKEIARLIEENERMDAEIKQLYAKYSIPSKSIMELSWGKLTNRTKTPW